MAEDLARIGDIDICFETFGSPDDPALLLIMGLGTQMIHWDEELCEALVARGLFVIRFDNRDTGRSTSLRHIPPPTSRELLARDTRRAGYTLSDMARDAVGLLDHLGVERAHVAGASMGGMIGQTMAIEHPDRLLSLTSIMSTTGSRRVGQPYVRLYPVLLRRPPRDPEAYAAHLTRVVKAIGSPAYPADPRRVRDLAVRAHARGLNPAGTGRQLHAILASGDRTALLRQVRVPTLVIHGDADRLVRPSGGKATAAAIPGARLRLIPGMGHDLPPALWGRLVELIADHADAATSDLRGAAAAG